MGHRRRFLAVLLAVSLADFLVGGGVRSSLAGFTEQETTAATFTTAACFVDTVAPSVGSTVGAKTVQYLPGYIRQGGTYFVFANVSDAGGGCTPSGVATVRTNVSSITTGQTTVTVAPGSFSVGGAAYGYRTASMTANTTLAAGTYSYSITSTDAATNSRLETGYTVIVDNTRPAGADIQTANGGSTVGKPEIGDTVTYAFTEPIDPQSVLAGWTGAATSVVARIIQGTGGDQLSIRNASNTAALPLGTANLVGTGYVTANRDFGATGTPSTMTQSGTSISITFGTASGATGTQASAGTVSWPPPTTLTDRAGNACQTAATLESGVADVEF
ncbi:MAG: hypothetical protein H0U52_09115 [Chloroflexi bacterium]|nr:hypothetical protein [Chloroflexota bacterium]